MCICKVFDAKLNVYLTGQTITSIGLLVLQQESRSSSDLELFQKSHFKLLKSNKSFIHFPQLDDTQWNYTT